MSEQTDNSRQDHQKPVNEPVQEPVNEPVQEPINEPVQEPAAESDSPADKADKAPISEKKRTALLRYMAVLFGVAFLLVLLSFFIQIRDSRETISDMNQSNASALQNAVKLQEANQTLTADKEELELQLSETEQELENARQETEDLKTQQEETEAAFAEEESLRESYELLFTAARHYESGAYADCMNVLTEELQPEDVKAFTEDARSYYDQLKTRCQEQIDAAAAAEE